MRLIAAACAALLLGGCQTAGPRLDRLFTDLHQRGLFDGAVVVAKGDRIVYEKAFGYANREQQVPFTPDTPADGASLAKTFTAALLTDLEAAGVLRLDDPARKFLPELPYPAITLRHLVSHSSGIPVADYDYFDPFLPRGQVRTTEALLAVLAAQRPPLAFEPGTAFEYSSFGYDLAALAVARAAGKPYDELLRERYFEPLGMSSAFLRPGRLADFPGVRTLGYRRGAVHDVFDFEGFHGGSNIYLSARDLHRWNASFFTRPVAERAHIGNGTSGLDHGSWYRSKDGASFWYSGHLQGFHDEAFRHLPTRTSIVYVSNNTIEPWLQKGIVRAVSAILAGRPVAPLEPPPTVDGVQASLAGRWQLDDGEVLTIDASHITREGVRYRMIPISGRAFYVPRLDLVLGWDGSRLHLSANASEEWGHR